MYDRLLLLLLFYYWYEPLLERSPIAVAMEMRNEYSIFHISMNNLDDFPYLYPANLLPPLIIEYRRVRVCVFLIEILFPSLSSCHRHSCWSISETKIQTNWLLANVFWHTMKIAIAFHWNWILNFLFKSDHSTFVIGTQSLKYRMHFNASLVWSFERVCVCVCVCLWQSFLVFIDHIISSSCVPLIFVAHKAIIFPFRYDLPLCMQLIHVIDGYMTVILNRLNLFQLLLLRLALKRVQYIFLSSAPNGHHISLQCMNSAMNDEQKRKKILPEKKD